LKWQYEKQQRIHLKNKRYCSNKGNHFSDPAKREAYTEAKLTITGLVYFILEPPDYDFLKKYPSSLDSEGLWVDVGFGNNPSHCIKLPQPLPEGAFYNWFFVNNWNSFIHIAAMDAMIKIK